MWMCILGECERMSVCKRAAMISRSISAASYEPSSTKGVEGVEPAGRQRADS
jgi:hypothetical protein